RSVDFGVVTNVTQNHLEEHDDFAHYTDTKRKLLRLQRPQCASVVNLDDPVSSHFVSDAPDRLLCFTTRGEEALAGHDGAFVRDGQICLRVDGRVFADLVALDALRLPGPHNWQNVMAAILVTGAFLGGPDKRSLGEARWASLGRAAADFGGVPGRLEWVRDLADLDFYYDIEATTPEATMRAVEAFPGRPVVLIGGGHNKGLSYAEWGRCVAQHEASVCLLPGDATPLMVDALHAERVEPEMCADLEQAMSWALEQAPQESVVILSPGAKGFYNDHIRGKSSFYRLAKRLRAAQRRVG
ncbi:MAG: hypothetical protein KC561_20335, partial [Myxococcales bacterium]|nr:hypothetical protein [Myxococcales bacterium]